MSALVTNFVADEFPGIATGYTVDMDNLDFNPVTMEIASGLIPAGLQKNDLSDSELMSKMAEVSITQVLMKNISIEARGYYLSSLSDLYFYVTPDGGTVTQNNENIRTGGKVIIKQPENIFNLQWLLAYSFTRMEVSKEEGKTEFMGIDQELPVYIEGFSRDIHSTFFQLKLGVIKDSLYLIGGARLDNYSDFGLQFTPRGGIIFQPTKKSSIKALYGRAFRAPAGDEVKGVNNFKLGNPDIKPETIDIFELIYIYKKKDFKVTANGFYSLWKNGIVTINNDDPEYSNFEFKIVNEGENSSFGGELNLFYSLEPFAVNLGCSYVKSKALDVADPVTGEKSDQDYVAFPKYIINAGLHFILEPADMVFYLNNRVYLKMKGAPLSIVADAEELPPYYRMDLDISKKIAKKMEIMLNIRNLLNRTNYVSTMTKISSPESNPEPGISVLLRVNYKF